MRRKKLPVIDDEEGRNFSAISKLIKLGKQKAYITIDDIMHLFPEAEQDVSQLEEAFAALMAAGIPYLEDDDLAPDPSEEELASAEVKEIAEEAQEIPDDDLKHIDTDDTIGLYLKEVSRVPLLTAEEEVDLSQRIERGRMSREELASRKV